MFRAIYLLKEKDEFQAKLAELDDAQLQNEELSPGDVTLRIEYSTLNYKDGLAIANKSPVVRKWPMVAGIDGAGVVEQSRHPGFKSGDRVILNGWGCLAQKARLKGDWLVPLPPAFTTGQAMAIGTAGYTAMLACMALERFGVKPDQGEILVTGAAGGVGSLAIAILAGWGYTVVASTGRVRESDYLKSLGAREIIERNTLSEQGKPLQKERWAGVIDALGSHTLAKACAQMKYRGVVAVCGLAQGMDFPVSVAPFILRGVVLAGIDSVYQPMPMRIEAWKRLASDLDHVKLDAITRMIMLSEVIATAPEILAGKVRGRLVVDVNG